ncbi:MAG: glycosyltransferase family 39 protein [Oscillatoria princeps RMCB-10]|jgi:hypothetical protein|nr:glycosyltransferase family 39 protein [Oscillatoria princeps RMCB-10]
MNLNAIADLFKHLWELMLFLIILGGPLPLCLSIVLKNARQTQAYSFAHSWLLIGTAWSLLQVLTGLFLGSIRQFHVAALILSEILIFAAGTLSLLRMSRRAPLSWRNLMTVSRQFNKKELLVAGSLSFVGLILLAKLATVPVTYYDSLWFHLPPMARWYQTHYFTLLDPAGYWIFEHQDAKVYPYNWEVLCALFLMPFGEDFLVCLPALIAWLLLGLSVYLLSRQFGATRYHSMAASSLVLTVPYIIDQVNTIHIDLPLASFYMACLYLALSYHRSRSATELALLLASLGMLAGLKTIGFIYAAFIAGLFALLEIISIRRKNNQSAAPKLSSYKQGLNPIVATGVLCLFVLGGFWYLRNFLEIKSYTAGESAVKVASTALSAISVPARVNLYKLQQSTLTNQFNPTDIAHWKTFGIQAIARLQIPFVAMVMQVLVLPVAFLSQRRIPHQTTAGLFAVLIATGFLYWNTPYSSGTSGDVAGQLSFLLGYNLRYGFSFLGVLGVAAAASATLMRTPDKFIAALVCLSTVTGTISSSLFDLVRHEFFMGNSEIKPTKILELFKESPVQGVAFISHHLTAEMSSLAASILIYIILLVLLLARGGINSEANRYSAKFSRLFRRSRRPLAFFIAISLTVSATSLAREKRALARTEIYGGIYEYIEGHIEPTEKIGYLLSSRNYIFYGKTLTQQVLHVPLKSDNISEWLKELRQKNVSYLALGPLDVDSPKSADSQRLKRELLRLENSGEFTRVSGKKVDKEPLLYRLNSQRGKN